MQIDIAAMYRPEECRFNNPLSTSTVPIAPAWILIPNHMLEFWLSRTFARFAYYERSLLKYFKYWLKKMLHLNEKDKAYPW